MIAVNQINLISATSNVIKIYVSCSLTEVGIAMNFLCEPVG